MGIEACPACGEVWRRDPAGGLHCPSCGAEFSEPLYRCVRCGRANRSDAVTCVGCESDLKLACPGCGAWNEAEADRCGECGRETDPLAHAFRPVGKSVEMRREALAGRISALREREDRESRLRLDALRAIDRRRMERSLAAADDAERRRRRIVVASGIAGAVFLVILLAALVFRI